MECIYKAWQCRKESFRPCGSLCCIGLSYSSPESGQTWSLNFNLYMLIKKRRKKLRFFFFWNSKLITCLKKNDLQNFLLHLNAAAPKTLAMVGLTEALYPWFRVCHFFNDSEALQPSKNWTNSNSLINFSKGNRKGGTRSDCVHLVVASGQEVEFKDVDHPRSEDDWQPLVVGDVLHHLSCVMRNKIPK